jgi:hypothetical protein
MTPEQSKNLLDLSLATSQSSSPRPSFVFLSPAMTEFVSTGGPLPHIPDHLTLSQFILDSAHECRPIRPQGVAWLVDDATGRKVSLDEVTTLPFDIEPLSIIEHLIHVKRFNLEYSA